MHNYNQIYLDSYIPKFKTTKPLAARPRPRVSPGNPTAKHSAVVLSSRSQVETKTMWVSINGESPIAGWFSS